MYIAKAYFAILTISTEDSNQESGSSCRYSSSTGGGEKKTAIGIAASYMAGVSIEAKDAIIYNRYEK